MTLQANEKSSTSTELEVKSIAQDKSDEVDVNKRFYALYAYKPQTQRKQESDGKTEEEDQGDDNGRCLSVLATNLVAAAEVDLRKTVAAWLTKDSDVGQGKFVSLGLNLDTEYVSSAICYSSVVSLAVTDVLGFDHVSATEARQGSEPSQGQQLFVVSFVSFQDSSLDLFRNEFDEYVKGLVPLLDKELYVTCSELSHGESESTNNSNSALYEKPVLVTDLSQLSTGIQTYLEGWPHSVLQYLTRTIQCLGADIEQLIYAALLNASLQISGASSENEEDIKRFYQCCSLSSLVEQLQPDSSSVRSTTGSIDSVDLWQMQAPIVSFNFKAEEESGGTSLTVDPVYSCTFCKNAADKLKSIDAANVTKIRDFLESIKLAFVHNLNKLKRFLKQAELDYYALYRSLSYLRKCGCGELLLQYAKMDGGSETLSVLSALETFVKDMKLSLK